LQAAQVAAGSLQPAGPDQAVVKRLAGGVGDQVADPPDAG
jgi:hypothetical protein